MSLSLRHTFDPSCDKSLQRQIKTKIAEPRGVPKRGTMNRGPYCVKVYAKTARFVLIWSLLTRGTNMFPRSSNLGGSRTISKRKRKSKRLSKRKTLHWKQNKQLKLLPSCKVSLTSLKGKGQNFHAREVIKAPKSRMRLSRAHQEPKNIKIHPMMVLFQQVKVSVLICSKDWSYMQMQVSNRKQSRFLNQQKAIWK